MEGAVAGTADRKATAEGTAHRERVTLGVFAERQELVAHALQLPGILLAPLAAAALERFPEERAFHDRLCLEIVNAPPMARPRRSFALAVCAAIFVACSVAECFGSIGE